MDPRFRRRLRPIATIILVFFSWFCIQPWNYVVWAQSTPSTTPPASKKPKSASQKFETSLRAAKDLIEDLDQEVAEEKDIGPSLEKLNAHRQAIEAADLEILSQFAETEAKLKDAKLPAEIMARHHKAVADYKANLKQFKDDLDAIEQLEKERKQAKANQDQLGEADKRNKLKDRIKGIKADLKEKVKGRKHTPLDPNKLPFRSPKPNKRKPRLKKEEFTEFHKPIQLAFNGDLSLLQLAQASPDLPTPQDLAETIEVQFTQEINDLAASLENHPVKIYNWVRNNIDFVPTWGSIQGADHCLLTKECNPMDTASLLIALLRTAGISARYAMGTIKVPIDQVINWAGGFTDKASALNFLSSGGIPIIGITSGGQISSAQLEHVWVEAYIDYIPSRGAIHKQGDTWIPLDASFKQYSITEGIDIDSVDPVDVEALLAEVENQTTIDSTIPSITGLPSALIQSQVNDFEVNLDAYLATNFPDVETFKELSTILHGSREIIKKVFPYFSSRLPVANLIVEGTPFSEVPDSLRHKITFKLTETNLIAGTSLSYGVNLSEIAGKRVTLSYVPATSSDTQLMADAEGILGLPLYLIEVVPELKIEGQTVASGQAIGMGTNQLFEMTFSDPTGIGDQVANTVQSGEYYAIGLDVNKVTFQSLKDRVDRWQPDTANERDDRLGELLYLMAMFYFANSGFLREEASKASGVMSLRHPSEAMVALNLNADFLFDVPVSISSVGLNMDVDRDILSPFSKNGSSDSTFWFMVRNGLNASAQEHLVFKSIMGLEAISTVKFLDLANSQLVPAYILDSENVQRVDELQVSLQNKVDIRNFINAGKIVIVPNQDIQHVDYSGIGYNVIDSETGVGGYLISGGFNGGETVGENVAALLDLGKELLGQEGIFEIYQDTIDDILSTHPGNIGDSINPQFKAFTKRMLFWGTFAKKLPLKKFLPGVKGFTEYVGFTILYHTEIMLISIP